VPFRAVVAQRPIESVRTLLKVLFVSFWLYIASHFSQWASIHTLIAQDLIEWQVLSYKRLTDGKAFQHESMASAALQAVGIARCTFMWLTLEVIFIIVLVRFGIAADEA
jgi:hypothetical protein